MTRIPAVERRVALVSAALRVIARRGVHGATTRAIVAEAGMSLASFHYAFASREELMVELVNAAVDDEELTLAPAFAADQGALSIRDSIRAGLGNYLEGVAADPDREKAMFELTQYALRSPSMEPLARRQYERYFALAADALEFAAARSGQVWQHPLDEVARMLVMLTDGLTLAWLVDRDDARAARAMDFAADSIAALAVVPIPSGRS